MNYIINVPVQAKKLREEAKPLQYAHEGDSGMDVYAIEIKRLGADKKPYEDKADYVKGTSSWIIKPGETILVCTGWAVATPEGTEVQVRPTSGNGLKTKMRIANTPGTVDSKYRGEVGVILENTGNENFKLPKGAKVAQLVVAPVYKAQIEVVDELDETVRGSAGYGSTGTMNSVSVDTIDTNKTSCNKSIGNLNDYNGGCH